MDINCNQNLGFCSRNKKIRFADDIARNVNKQYPRISHSLVCSMNNSKKFPHLLSKLDYDIASLRSIKRDVFELSSNFPIQVKSLTAPIKMFKVGNCGESAELSMLAALANGIKNCKKCSLKTPNVETYDHGVVLVNDKKPYIIDAWLGFADYVPNAIKRYQGEFRHHFDFKELKTEKMVVVPASDKYYTNSFLNNKFSNEQIEIIKNTLPELILKKKK